MASPPNFSSVTSTPSLTVQTAETDSQLSKKVQKIATVEIPALAEIQQNAKSSSDQAAFHCSSFAPISPKTNRVNRCLTDRFNADSFNPPETPRPSTVKAKRLANTTPAWSKNPEHPWSVMEQKLLKKVVENKLSHDDVIIKLQQHVDAGCSLGKHRFTLMDKKYILNNILSKTTRPAFEIFTFSPTTQIHQTSEGLKAISLVDRGKYDVLVKRGVKKFSEAVFELRAKYGHNLNPVVLNSLFYQNMLYIESLGLKNPMNLYEVNKKWIEFFADVHKDMNPLLLCVARSRMIIHIQKLHTL